MSLTLCPLLMKRLISPEPYSKLLIGWVCDVLSRCTDDSIVTLNANGVAEIIIGIQTAHRQLRLLCPSRTVVTEDVGSHLLCRAHDCVAFTSTDLVNGSNLVGYSSVNSWDTPDAVSSIEGQCVAVWAFIEGSWKVYDPANPGFSDLTTMAPGYGYWIDVSEACVWDVP